MDLQKLSEISALLPNEFPFFSVGTVARSTTAPSSERDLDFIQGKSGVSFKLLGEPAALLIVLFDRALDHSMYSELGNILASKLCQRLSEQGEGDLMITPPLMLKPEQLQRLSLTGAPFIRQSYEHAYQDKKVLVETIILPISAEGLVGHA
jgi:hypothetical protein